MTKQKIFALDDLFPLLDVTRREDEYIIDYEAIEYVVLPQGIFARCEQNLSRDEVAQISGYEALWPASCGNRLLGKHDGTPLLPNPFTAEEMLDFDKRTGVIYEGIKREDETDAWIANLERPHSRELAQIILTKIIPEPVDTDASGDAEAVGDGVPMVIGSTEKPWLLVDPKDPKPEQGWYTPARYFAR